MESTKDKYFIDGFLIKHFNIFPLNFDKENLFDEQKIFLIYLLGVIPEIDVWKMNVDYKLQLNEIKNVKVKLTETEIDIAKFKGKSLSDVTNEKIKAEKIKRISELNKKFGIKDENEDEDIEKVVETKSEKTDNNPAKLWQILQGKGLVQ